MNINYNFQVSYLIINNSLISENPVDSNSPENQDLNQKNDPNEQNVTKPQRMHGIRHIKHNNVHLKLLKTQINQQVKTSNRKCIHRSDKAKMQAYTYESLFAQSQGLCVQLIEPIVLDLSQQKDLTDEDLRKLIQFYPDVTKLALKGCTKITDTGLEFLGGLTQLKYLDLQQCSGITDVGLLYLGNLKSLTHLNIVHCSQLTDAGHLKLNLSGFEQIQ